MKSLHILRTVALVAVFVAPWALQANVLVPGGSVLPDALNVGANLFPPLVGFNATLVATTNVQTSNIGTSGVQAEFIENVYSDPIGNLACPLGGCLDFVIAVKNIGNDIIEHVTTSSFTGTTTDVGIQILNAGPCALAGATNPTCIINDAGGVLQPFAPSVGGVQTIPDMVSRSKNGAVISFDFTTLGVNPGDVTDLLVIETNATHFGAGTLGFIDGSGASGLGFAPTPEPRFISFAAMGLFGLVLFFVRRRKAAVAAE
jgi:hypothetical protein